MPQKLYCPTACVGASSVALMTLTNPSRLPLAYEWDVPERLRAVLSVDNPAGVLRGRESIELAWTFAPKAAQDYLVKVPCLVSAIDDGADGAGHEIVRQTLTVSGVGSTGLIQAEPLDLAYGTVLVGATHRPPRGRRDGPTSAESADAQSLAVGAATTREHRRRALASNATNPHPTPSPPPPTPPPAANASSPAPARAELVNADASDGGTTSRSRETSGSDRAAVEGGNGADEEGAYVVDEGARAHARDDDDRSVGYGAREYVPFAVGVAALSIAVLMCFDTLVALTLLLCLGAVVAACVMVLNNSESDTRWRDDEFNGPM